MYEFHYDYMLLNYDYKVKLCFMDSFIYSIKLMIFIKTLLKK